MGLNLFTALGLALVDMGWGGGGVGGSGGAAILAVTTTWQQQWPVLFEGLGCLTKFTHQPLLNPAVTHVIQPLHCIPLAFCDGVSAAVPVGCIKSVDALPFAI